MAAAYGNRVKRDTTVFFGGANECLEAEKQSSDRKPRRRNRDEEARDIQGAIIDDVKAADWWKNQVSEGGKGGARNEEPPRTDTKETPCPVKGPAQSRGVRGTPPP